METPSHTIARSFTTRDLSFFIVSVREDANLTGSLLFTQWEPILTSFAQLQYEPEER